MAYDLVLLNSVFRQTALHSALHAQPSWWYIPFAVDFTVSFWLMLGLTRPMINLGKYMTQRNQLELCRYLTHRHEVLDPESKKNYT